MRTNRENLPIFIQVDKSLLGYLCTALNEDAKMVLVNLRDMATIALDRLQTKSYGQMTWTKVQYPNTTFHLKIRCKIGQNHLLKIAHRQEYEDKFVSDTGFTRSKKRQELKEFWSRFRDWQNNNPFQYVHYDYNALIIEVMLYGKASYIILSQEEIDTILVENILLAPEE